MCLVIRDGDEPLGSLRYWEVRLGDEANATRPEIEQIMFSMPAGLGEEEAERQLYVVRRRIEKAVTAELISDFYICSMSSRSIIY